jgi:hypothetical protein
MSANQRRCSCDCLHNVRIDGRFTQIIFKMLGLKTACLCQRIFAARRRRDGLQTSPNDMPDGQTAAQTTHKFMQSQA